MTNKTDTNKTPIIIKYRQLIYAVMLIIGMLSLLFFEKAIAIILIAVCALAVAAISIYKESITVDDKAIMLQTSVNKLSKELEDTRVFLFNKITSRIELLDNKSEIMSDSINEVIIKLIECVDNIAQISNIKLGNKITDDFEIIKDEDNNVTVKNYFFKGKLLSSEMYSGNTLKLSTEYGDSKNVTFSKNFDNDGNITNETQFYENGQVHIRKEWKYGENATTCIITEYDENGTVINKQSKE